MTLDFAEPALDGGAGRRIDPAFRAHYLTIVRLCMRQLGDPNDAEDAAQETFRRALQQRGGVVGDPLPWLIAVARNVCIDELRRRRSGRSAFERSAAQVGDPQADAEGEANPERLVVGRMFVNELLGRLTPAERRVVAGTVIDGQSGGELAQSLGVTASTTRVLLARAREKMRRYLRDGQVALNGAVFAGWRGALWVRHRLLSRPLALQPRAELLLPALAMSAIVSAAGAPGTGGAYASRGGTAFLGALASARNDERADSAGRSEMPPAGTMLYSAPSAATATRFPSGRAPHAGGPLGTVLPAPDPDQVWVTDFEASPNYQSDHTIYMLGTGGCLTACDQLFRSADGGATWTYVPAAGLHSSQLLIPASSYGQGRFYGVGGNLLQVTSDGGAHFRNDEPVTGFAAAAPPWLGAQVVTSDVSLSFIDGSLAPHVVAVYAPGQGAAGAPVLLPSQAGFTALQLVQNYVTSGDDTLLGCSAAGCTTLGQVPLSGEAQLLTSPNFAVDHTLVAVGGGVAVSRDGGTTFTLVSSDLMFQAITVAGPAGERLIAVNATHPAGADDALVYSDDWGLTWHTATLMSATGSPAALAAHTVRALAPGQLIASAADPERPGMHIFVCSHDGASWSGCAAHGQ